MRKLLISAALLSMTSAGAFAQAGTPQGDTIVPNPPASASSNDMSRSPGAGMPDSTAGKSMTTGTSTGKHAKKHKKKSKTPAKKM